MHIKGTNVGTDYEYIECSFDETQVEAKYTSDHEIICRSPPKRPGNVSLSLTKMYPEGRELLHRDAFEYTIMATVFSITPSKGSSNSSVEVTGSGFLNSSNLHCRFNDHHVPARYLTSSKILCNVPHQNIHNQSTVLVSVSNNFYDVEGDWANIHFLYMIPPKIISIHPVTAPSSGGTNVFVRGTNFLQFGSRDVVCKFGTLLSNGTVLGNDEIVCTLPEVDIAENAKILIQVFVSLNGGCDFNIGANPRVLVHLPSVVDSVIPRVQENGQSIVSVYGKHFYREPDFACMFGDTISPAKWISEGHIQCPTPELKSKLISLRVTTNGQVAGASSSNVTIMFDQTATLTSMTPMEGPTATTITMSLRGTGFKSKNDFICRFGDILVRAEAVLNSTTATCVLPASYNRHSVPVDISINGGDEFTLSGLQFTFKSRITINSIHPRSGPVTGGTQLTLYGNFTRNPISHYLCCFDMSPNGKSCSTTSEVSDGQARCYTPPHTSLPNDNRTIVTTVDIVALNNPSISFATKKLTFTYYSGFSISSVDPSLGTELGGTNVTIKGFFPRSKKIFCRFGDHESLFTQWIDFHSILCTSPPVRKSFLKNPLVTIAVSINEQDYTYSPSAFRYVIASHISSFTPIFGPSGGGTTLRLRGGGFLRARDSEAFCVLGDSLTEAIILSDSLAECLVPKSQINGHSVELKISFNDGLDLIKSDESYTVIDDPIITEVFPIFVPSSGGTLISIIGENFSPSIANKAAWCSMGDIIVEGQVVNSSMITFSAPSVSQTMSAPIRVSLNGFDFSSNGPMISFSPTPNISNVFPPFAHERGGGNLFISGTGFYNSSELACVFLFDQIQEIVGARFVSFHSIVCKTPPLPNRSLGKVKVQLSFSRSTSTGLQVPAGHITYYTATSIISINPPFGPQSGGTELAIRGTGFNEQEEGYFCVFERDVSYRYIKASILSDAGVRCQVPPMTTEDFGGKDVVKTSVKVALRAFDDSFSDTGFSDDVNEFSYYRDTILDRVEPEIGSTFGETNISVYGRHFMNTTSLQCVFTVDEHRYFEPAKFVNTSFISCSSPMLSEPMYRRAIMSQLQVSMNGKDLSIPQLRFQFTSPIVLISVEPTIVSERGGSLLTITGKNLVPSKNLTCVFKGTNPPKTSTATIINTEKVQCRSPIMQPDSYFVSLRTTTFESIGDLALDVHSSFEVFDMDPNLGPFSGGTRVLIKGQNFQNSSFMVCKFGYYDVTKATFLSPKEVTCSSPEQMVERIHPVPVGFSTNGVDFIYCKKNFVYAPLPKIHKIFPSSGVFGSAIKVTLSGENLMIEGSQVLVSFGDMIVGAQHMNETQVSFAIPSISGDYYGTEVPVEISTNGGSDFSTSGKTFQFEVSTYIESIHPTIGSTVGKDKVQVSGAGFKPHLNIVCRFGTKIVSARVLSLSELECRSPSADIPGPVAFDISSNGFNWTDSGVQYTYLVPPVVSSVHPSNLSLTQETVVHIEGHNFNPNVVYSCAFGNFSISLAFFSSVSSLTCASPTVISSLSVDFSLLSEETVVSAINPITVNFVERVEIEINPTFGSKGGGTKIEVFLENPLKQCNSEMTCDFELRSGLIIQSKAERMNETFLSCTAPSVISQTNLDFVHSKFSIGSLCMPELSLGSAKKTFTFIESPSLFQISPKSGVTLGGTKVKIVATQCFGFWLNSKQMACRFGSESAPARFISSCEVECITPALSTHDPFEVDVFISDNGYDFLLIGDFKYFYPSELISVLPTFGVSSESTKVLIRGFGFDSFDQPSCLFDYEGVKMIESATVINATSLTCVVPTFTIKAKNGMVDIYTANNHLDFFAEPLKFIFIQKPEIFALKPSFGLHGYDTVVALQGRFPIEALSTLNCIVQEGFSGIYLPVSAASETEVMCEISCRGEASLQPYYISVTAGFNMTSQRQLFRCQSAPFVDFLEPSVVTFGSSLIKVKGNNFPPNFNMGCCSFSGLFGVQYSPSTYIDRSTISCQTPDFITEQNVNVSISNNCENFHEETRLNIEVIPIHVYDVFPKAIFAGDKIKIEGYFPGSIDHMSCAIGGVICSSLKISSDKSELHCNVPYDLMPDEKGSIDIFFNDNVIAANMSIVVQRHPRLIGIEPSHALKVGGQMLMLAGEFFPSTGSQEALCHFDDTMSPAQIISSTSALCEIPKIERSQEVNITMSFGSTTILGSQRLEIMDSWVIHDIKPYSGSLKGGTKILVHGENFVRTVVATCFLGSSRSILQVLSNTLAFCYTPASSSPGIVEFKIVIESSHSSSAAIYDPQKVKDVFYFYEEGLIINVFFSRSSELRDAILAVEGTWHFNPTVQNLLDPKCRFGDYSSSGSLISPNILGCESLPNLRGNWQSDLEISWNGVDFLGGNLTHGFLPEFQVNSVSPLHGHVSGNTKVTISWHGLLGLAPGIQCRFGNYHTTHGELDATTGSIFCLTPVSNKPDQVPLYLKVGEMSPWRDTGFFFRFEENILLRDFHPKQALDNGNELIYIAGEGFGRSHTCIFQGLTSSQVAAKVISSTMLSCNSPPAADIGVLGQGFVSLSIADEYGRLAHLPNSLEYQPTIKIYSIHPAIGPSFGGTTVSVNGLGFTSGSPLLCWFGDFATEADVISNSLAACASSSSYIESGKDYLRVNFRITKGGSIGSYEHTKLPFLYYKVWPTSKITLSPSTGPSNAHVEVMIKSNYIMRLIEYALAQGISNDLKIKVEDSEVPGELRNGDDGTYISFELLPNLVSYGDMYSKISLSLNDGGNYHPCAPFEFYTNPKLMHSFPEQLLLGHHSELLVSGSGFLVDKKVTCRIGSLVMTGISISNSTISCHLPEASALMRASEQLQQLSISFNGIDFSETIPMVLKSGPIFWGRSTYFVSQHGGSLVPLRGANLFSLDESKVAIRLEREEPLYEAYAEITSFEDHLIEFRCPPGKGSFVSVVVELDINRTMPTGMLLQFDIDPFISSLNPFHGNPMEGYDVLIGGTFNKQTVYSCLVKANHFSTTEGLLKTVMIDAVFVNQTFVSCSILPSREFFGSDVEGIVDVSIFRNRDSFESNSRSFVFSESHALLSVVPDFIPEEGNTLLTIRGNFLEYTEINFCSFAFSNGSIIKTPATVISSEEVRCYSPSYHVPGRVQLSVTNSFTSDVFGNSLTLSFRESRSITSIQPSHGGLNGGTKLSILLDRNLTRSEFLADLLCSFADVIYTIAMPLDSTVVQCTSPKYPVEGSVSFKLISRHTSIFGNVAYFPVHEDENTFYHYNEDPSIIEIVPATGPVSGGSILKLKGIGLNVSISEIIIKFTSLQNPSLVEYGEPIEHEYDEIRFVTPMSPNGKRDGQVMIQLSTNNGGDYSPKNLNYFEYKSASYSIESIYPSVIPEYSLVNITVRGEGFSKPRPLVPYLCKFGETKVTSIWISTDTLSCTSPSNLKVGTVKVSVLFDNQHSFNRDLTIRAPVEIERAGPLVGPFRGGATIDIKGTGFVVALRTTLDLVCVFGNVSYTSAIVKNDTSVSCKSPSFDGMIEGKKPTWSSFRVPFQLSWGESGFSRSFTALNHSSDVLSLGHEFLVFREERIVDMSPRSGSLNDTTLVKVVGKGFLNTPYLSCRVGGGIFRRARFINQSTIECIIPPAIEVFGSNSAVLDAIDSNGLAKISIFVSNCAQELPNVQVGSSSSFYYYARPSFLYGYPKSGPAGTTLYLHTESLPFLENPLCKFGEAIVKARKVAPLLLTCTVPKMLRNTHCDVSVSLNGQAWYQSGIYFQYIEVPVVHRIVPSVGPDLGGNNAIIYGANFDKEALVLCKFGEETSKARILSTEKIICSVPPQQVGAVKVSMIVVDGTIDVFETKSGPMYTYAGDLIIDGLKPDFGSIEGGTVLTINVTGLNPVLGLVCVFNEDALADISMISSSQIQCVVPPAPNYDTGRVIVRIAISSEGDLAFLNRRGVVFTYTSVPYIESVSPSRGLLEGGETVMISGGNFYTPFQSKFAKCKFGGIEAEGQILSNETMKCVTPVMPTFGGNREIQSVVFQSDASSDIELLDTFQFSFKFEGEESRSISFEVGQVGIQNALLSLESIGDVSISSIVTTHVLGIVKKEFNVTFTTLGSPSNVGPLPLLKVLTTSRFDIEQIFISRIQQACCKVEISLNDIDFFGTATRGDIMPFTFDGDVLVEKVEPSFGTIDGGTTVSLIGSGFSAPIELSNEFFCVFGSKYVRAKFISPSIVECKTPEFVLPARVVVSLQQYSVVAGTHALAESVATFEYMLVPEVESIFPRMLDYKSLEKWTAFDIHGTNFISSTALQCSFQQNWPTVNSALQLKNTIKTNALFHNSSFVSCLHEKGIDNISNWRNDIYVSITFNGNDWTPAKSIAIVSPLLVSKVHPSTGPRSGGSILSITGEYFIDSDYLACKFGDYPQVPAQFHSTTAISCKTPRHDHYDSFEKITPIAVTNNGLNFVWADHITFKYFDDFIINSFSPVVGPSIGGTPVNITLKSGDLSKSHIIQCKFNATLVVAKVLNADTILCLSPASHASGGSVSLMVSGNGIDFPSNERYFFYLPGQRNETFKMKPSHGPMIGGTKVRIEGLATIPLQNTLNSMKGRAKCRFGNIIVPVFESDYHGGSVTCMSPHSSLHNDTLIVPVDVSATGMVEDFTSVGALFSYDRIVSVSEINPVSGIISGGTVVDIYGGPFQINTDEELLCRFGTSVVNATWESENKISCRSPARLPVKETQTLSLFSMAWNQEIQSVSCYANDLQSEQHEIYTTGVKDPRPEVQIVQINGTDVENEVQRITTGLDTSNLVVIDIDFLINANQTSLKKITSHVAPGSALEGYFEIYKREKTSISSSGALPFNISSEKLRDAIITLDIGDGEMFVSDTNLSLAGTKSWLITYIGTKNLSLQVNGNGLYGKDASVTIEDKIRGDLPEIQLIQVNSFTPVLGFMSFFFNGYKTSPLKWNASDLDVKKSLEELPTVGRVDVSRETVTHFNEEYGFVLNFRWLVTFRSFIGDAPSIEVCCDSRSALDEQTVFALKSDDLIFEVLEVERGTGEKLEGFFEIILEDYASDILKSIPIKVNATAEDIISSVKKIPVVVKDTVSVVKSYNSIENSAARFTLSFGAVPLSDTSLLLHDVPSVSIRSVLQGQTSRMVFHVKQNLVRRAKQLIEYSTKVEVITCHDGSGNGFFSFVPTSAESAIKDSIESVINQLYGKVSVTKYVTDSDIRQVIIVFMNIGTSKISCNNARVQFLSNGTKASITGGYFSLNIGSNSTLPISYNATAHEVQLAIEMVTTWSSRQVLVSEENIPKFTGKDGGHSWLVTFIGHNSNDSYTVSGIHSQNLIGPNAFVKLANATSDSLLTGSFRLKIRDYYSTEIKPFASAKDIKYALEDIPLVDKVSVTQLHSDSTGGGHYLIEFPEYIGKEPNGFIPWTAGNIPPLQVDTSSLRGVRVLTSTITIQEGTNPISSNQYKKGFRIISPGGSKLYPLQNQTRWLRHNETCETMKNALLEASGYKYDMNINRTGPYKDGSYRWSIILPSGQSMAGDTWSVVREGGGAVDLSGDEANVRTVLSVQGSEKLTGTFRMGYAEESTFDLNVNVSDEGLKLALEELESITTVEVHSSSLDLNETGSGARRWYITFTSLANAGDIPLLSANSSLLGGTGSRIEVRETRRGVSNEVKLLRVPTNTVFKIIFDSNEGPMLHFDSSHLEIERSIMSICEKKCLVQTRSQNTTLDMFFLLLSDASKDITIDAEVYIPCYNNGESLCLHSTILAEVAFASSTKSFGGSFLLGYDTSSVNKHEEDDDHRYYCTEKTDSIPVTASPKYIEYALEKLSLIKNVEVTSLKESSLVYTETGLVGEGINYQIRLIEAGLCGPDDFVQLQDSLVYDVPLLRVDGSNMLGDADRDPITLLDRQFKIAEFIEGPVNKSSSVFVDVSVNGADFSQSRTTFWYYLDLQTFRPFPQRGYGGTSVVFLGMNFTGRPSTLCHFDITRSSQSVPAGIDRTTTVKAHFLNTSHVKCIAPPSLRYGTIDIYLSREGSSAGDYIGKAMFTYDQPISILNVRPISGSFQGGFPLDISGGPFPSETGLLCKFGSTSIVPALYLSSNKITCVAPAQSPGIYLLSVSQNGQDFSDEKISITFYEDFELHSITPASGPTGSQVHVHGNGFKNSTDITCRFQFKVVPAEFISSKEIMCTSPSLPSKETFQWLKLSELPPTHDTASPQNYPEYLSVLVNLEVSMNSQDFPTSDLKFLYQDDIFISNISNKNGPSNGGTPVFIKGSGFVNSTYLSCRFGHYVTKAIFLTRGAVVCFTPPKNVLDQEQKFLHRVYLESRTLIRSLNAQSLKVYIEVSNNGVDFSEYRHEFEFTVQNRLGFYQPGVENSTLLLCPRGAYCADDSLRNFTLCPKGTYQPHIGQQTCLRCPIGFMCPEQGLPLPRICPPGYICDVTGTENAEQPCPAGFHCPAGTGTSATFCGTEHGQEVSISYTLAQRGGTILKGQEPLGFDRIFGHRNIACWDNSTDDFGLQTSEIPSRIWDEHHDLPFDQSSPLVPIRGRYCGDDACLSLPPSVQVSLGESNLAFSSFHLKRPLPCPAGTFCQAGTASNTSDMSSYYKPHNCINARNCAEGSSSPRGIGDCPKGFFCRFGGKEPCPVGTFCPSPGQWDPFPCEPGTFNFMIGQISCISCPVGHYCNGYGRVDPALCFPGLVCSKEGLTSPNIRCPAGFYCLNGTQTSDPFRNDTSMRPYPCSPGSYCLSGTGSNEMVENDFFFAQPCPAGFYCEAASTSARGTGLCPPGYVCPKGTATPIPTPKGHYAKYSGTIHAAPCLPGFYSPTIESTECYPCPPGTSCETEGLSEASICPPGTFRDPLAGVPCTACPQGTWSRNGQLKEVGECTRCPTGILCPIDGMTIPCNKNDLPSIYEPIVNLNGAPVLEFDFPSVRRPPAFSIDECLDLNVDTNKNGRQMNEQQFYYGELVPPYIDILGRGSHFRSCDDNSIKYGKPAKCYRNIRPHGSIIYQRLAAFHGPQFDIHSGYPHQGHGFTGVTPQMFKIAPLQDHYDKTQTYYHGPGSIFLDLPRAVVFDSSFNCTPGFSLLNASNANTKDEIVYTSEMHDYQGGLDVKRCSFFDETLNCYVDPTFQLHERGECCELERWKERAIYEAEDQFYAGTCEADFICLNDEMTEATPCQDGFVCNEGTDSEGSYSNKCPAGYICDFGTTPDVSLAAPKGLYKYLCDKGFFCAKGSGLTTRNNECPVGYFCPTGTADPVLGTMADDSLKRMVSYEDSLPYKDIKHVTYFGHDVFHILSQHDANCIAGLDSSLQHRFRVVQESEVNPLSIQTNDPGRLLAVSSSIFFQSKCSRDSKVKLLLDVVHRKECDCNAQFFCIIALYRFWKVRTFN